MSGGAMALIDKRKYLAATGIPAETLNGWLRRHLERGKHFVVQGRTTLVNPEAIEQWLLESAGTAPVGKPEFRSTGNRKARHSDSPIARLVVPGH